MIQETLKSLELQNIYGQLSQLVEEAEGFGKGAVCAADIERHLLKSLLKMGKDLLSYSFGVRHEELEKQDVREDFNLNGDVNGEDKVFWFENNGVSSRVPK